MPFYLFGYNLTIKHLLSHFYHFHNILNEHSSKSLLTQKLPDSTFGVDAFEDEGKGEVGWSGEGVYVEEHVCEDSVAALRAKFLGMRCMDKAHKGGVREFLEGLRLKKEELCQAWVNIDKKDYFKFSVIISSLPAAMLNFASSQLA